MLGRKEPSQLEMFISGSLRQLIHVLVRVDRVFDAQVTGSGTAATGAGGGVIRTSDGGHDALGPARNCFASFALDQQGGA